MRSRKQVLAAVLLAVAIGGLYATSEAANLESGKTTAIVRVPKDAKVYEQGKLLGPKSVSKEEKQEGRILELAYEETGAEYWIREYEVATEHLSDIQVYNWALQQMEANVTEDTYYDYTGASQAFTDTVTPIVEETARVYTNCASGAIGLQATTAYIKAGSEAYQKVSAALNVVKWGRFMPAPTVATCQVSDILPLSEVCFTCKATVTCEPMEAYMEKFAIYMLFQAEGNTWKMTDFTFMP